jgi:Uma2 family endonuclease
MAQPASESRRYTYADYCSWSDDERWELIDGEAYVMSPAPARVHQDVVVELVAQIHGALENTSCRVYVAPFDVRLPNRDEADDAVQTVVQPDIAVICDPSKLDDKGCRGAPDWIIEVLSPATAAKDQIQKRDLYERHGVKEYWLVHPSDQLLFVYRLDAGAYGKPEVSTTQGCTAASTLIDLEISWERVFPAAERKQGRPRKDQTRADA